MLSSIRIIQCCSRVLALPDCPGYVTNPKWYESSGHSTTDDHHYELSSMQPHPPLISPIFARYVGFLQDFSLSIHPVLAAKTCVCSNREIQIRIWYKIWHLG